MLYFAETEFDHSVELQSFQLRTHPESQALVVTGSSAPLHTFRAGSSGYLASFFGYEVLYSYYRRWRFRECLKFRRYSK